MSYRDDPVWQQAHEMYLHPPEASSTDRLLTELLGIVTMWYIESTTDHEPTGEREQAIAGLTADMARLTRYLSESNARMDAAEREKS